jgi:uncharacterized protein (UPF0248 family)
MGSVREVLNKIRWTGDMDTVEIWYVHRGAPEDMKMVHGCDVSEVGRSFLKVGESMIPHHRVFRIVDGGKVVFERKPWV